MQQQQQQQHQIVGSEPAARAHRLRPLEPLGAEDDGNDGNDGSGVRRDPCGWTPSPRRSLSGLWLADSSVFLTTQDGAPAEEEAGARTRRPPAASSRGSSPANMGAGGDLTGDPAEGVHEGEQSPPRLTPPYTLDLGQLRTRTGSMSSLATGSMSSPGLDRQKLRTPTGKHWSPTRQRHRRATDSELMRGVYLASLAFNLQP